jgi:hypothetical protein
MHDQPRSCPRREPHRRLVEPAPGSDGRVPVAQLAEFEREIRSRLISQFA